MKELIVDNFAGGGGASSGIWMATGRGPDIAINHDRAAIKMHMANFPETKHYCEDIFDIDPVKVCDGRKVGLAWFSPDCKHFSKAKGGKLVSKKIRGLAWVVVKWAKLVKPRVIILENVEEFKTWGPLKSDNKPDPQKKGKTFHYFVQSLKKCGYEVEYQELLAADYGAPTKRNRFYLIARSDGHPIVWPSPTHGDPDSLEVHAGIKKPWIPAADIIDWTIPCPSIFARKKPLCENTMKRIARGMKKFIFENPNPYVVKNGLPMLIQYHGEQSDKETRGQSIRNPLMVVDSSNRYGLVTAFISKYFAGEYSGAGSNARSSLSKVTAIDHNALVMPYMMYMYGQSTGGSINRTTGTITAAGQHIAEIQAFLIKYYGQGVGQGVNMPLDTITARDRFGLIMVKDEPYQIIDIGMRMLTPRELFNAQGFPKNYVIDKDADGKNYPKSAQVARCGNAVCPPVAAALIRANVAEMCVSQTA